MLRQTICGLVYSSSGVARWSTAYAEIGKQMMTHDPVHRMLERKAENRTANLIRNQLQLQARLLIRKHFDLISKELSAHDIRVSNLIGEIECYISIRRELAPMVCQDGYSAELTQKLNQLKDLEQNNAL